MLTLAKLKRKWFIDTTDSESFPPQVRHPAALLRDHVDGNLVTPLIDGVNIMGHFQDRMEELMNVDDPSQSELWLAAMGIEQVQLKGIYRHSKGAINEILDAVDSGIRVSFLASGQANLAIGSRRFARSLIDRGGQGTVDSRFPIAGGHHQKFYITFRPENDWEAVVGSADFFQARWDTREHLLENPHRPGGPTHDMSVAVKGPAAVDIAATFAERWNDLKSNKWTNPKIKRALPEEVQHWPAEVGTHSVQVLRTYPIMKSVRGYTWSDAGEFTVWASYINAIKHAQSYIYIEDQYLYPLGDPPFIWSGSSAERETDFVYQLGEALKRGVDVVALVPGRDDALSKHYENQQRRRATEYLDGIAKNTPGAGRFVVAKLHKEGKDITIHSKVMLVDDEFALVGTANICQRSIAYITEIQLGIVDEQNEFVRDLRLDLWQEHLELETPDSIRDPHQAVEEFYENAAAGNGRLVLYSTERFEREFPYRWIMNHLIDPYAGPPRR